MLTTSLLMFRNNTQTYKHTPPPPHHPTPFPPTPPFPPKERDGLAPPPLWGGEGSGWDGG